ncbi:MAG: T9SS type A sorting domain-containing protein [Candidatus Delongbacteria bacterium]|nr:T9SS type A sorting domain-containing protein [Candidatus Delongbacteria bacterium]
MWHLLVKDQGFSPDKVYFLYANGKDYPLKAGQPYMIPDQYWMDYYQEYGFNYEEQSEDFKQLAYSSASIENIEDIFDSLSTVMTQDDFLLVSTISHGGYEFEEDQPEEGVMLIYEEPFYEFYRPTISDNDLADIIELVPANKKVFWLGQCHSENFIDDFELMSDGSNKIMNSACKMTEESTLADDKAWTEQSYSFGTGIEFEHLFEAYPDECVYHDEFTVHLYTSTAGNRPFALDEVRRNIGDHPYEYQRPSASADFEWFNIMEETDINYDGVVTIEESSIWLDNHNSIITQKSVFSDQDNIGSTTSLLYPTLIFNNYADYRLRGLMGISADLNVVNNDLILIDNSHTTLLEGRKINISSGYNLVVQSGAVLKLKDASEIFIDYGSNLTIEPGAIVEVEGNASIIGDIKFPENAKLDIANSSELHLQISDFIMLAGSNIDLGTDSKLVVENDADLILNSGSVIEASEGAEIVVMNKGELLANGTTFSCTDILGYWLGINCLTGSTVTLNSVNIHDAVTAIQGDGMMKFEVTNSDFENCVNGIDLLSMNSGYKYIIENNTLYGTDEGTGIMITGADGTFSNNNITHFNIGTYFLLCSPVVSGCEMTYSKHYGMVISGNDAMPLLISTEDQIPIYKSANCVFEKNAYESNSSLFPSAHIGINPTGNIYMRNNDVYSSPNFPAISIGQKDIRDQYIVMDVQYNFWGYEVIDDDYFYDHPNYTLDYTPYYSAPCGTDIVQSEIMQSISEESRIISNALNLESNDKINPAINLYEHIIDKYVDTPEYYVAMSRLPYLYEQEGLDNNELITMYDAAIASEETSHKKFFKGRKVATHIKGKRFDDAIVVAEEMKAEADNDEEIILAEINIGIANMLKDLENQGKGRSTVDHSDNLNDLLDKLTESANKGGEDKSDITGTTLPTEHTLYQNYPNPFNPVTQIKFALPTASDVKLCVYNINGQLVSELVNESKEAGIHTVCFDASNFNSGMYFYTLEANGTSITKKMILTK